MEEEQIESNRVPWVLPWAVGAGALIVFLVTLNHWVSLASLPLVAKVTGWDWVLPHQLPLFFLLTFPLRWLPVASQPIAFNALSAVCAALTLALLARSVMLLPHDRTHEQRQRERSEFSLLSIPAAWLPPIFAVLVCAFELTFWEHAGVATNEMLDLLIFAYVVRCLLEYRIDPRDSWLFRFAFVYGLGVANNWALLGFAPFFLVGIAWIKGLGVLQFPFLVRFLGCGLAGLSMYLLLPLAWALSNHPVVGFWEALRANLVFQKAMLFNNPGARFLAIILGTTAILPVLIMGIRWPASFGDTSAAGAALTNFMFRSVHLVLFGACLWVALDQRFFSARVLVPKRLQVQVPFLTYYYLGALSVGYFAGYLLLVFGEHRSSKSWRRRSGMNLALQKLVVGLVWLVAIAVPGALVYQNFKQIQQNNGPVLSRMAADCAEGLPSTSAIVLSDYPYSLLLLEAELSRAPGSQRHVLVHTRSLSSSDYHLQLSKKYPQRWPSTFADPDEIFDDGNLLQLLTDLARTNAIYYLHPSFGFYFERFHARPHGLVSELVLCPTNTLAAVPLKTEEIGANEGFWSKHEDTLAELRKSGASRDTAYVRTFYSRALNAWGVALQRNTNSVDATKYFEKASELNTNNIPAYVNLQFNQARRSGIGQTNVTSKTIEDRFGPYRSWDVLAENGPFDQPEFCMHLGDIFVQQRLFRQAAIEFQRVTELEPNNLVGHLALAGTFLRSGRADEAIARVREIQSGQETLSETALIELARLEANAEFAKKNVAASEKLLLDTHARFPKSVTVLDTLVQLYAQERRYAEAMRILDKLEKLAPDHTQLQMNRATIYFNTKANDKALAILDQILERDPKSIRAQLYKTFIFVQQRDFQKAAPLVENILRLDPENSEALTYQGVIAIENKDYSAAIPPLDRVLKAEPGDWNALRNRAIAYLQMGNLTKARQDYDLLVRLMPGYYVAYYGLGEIAFRKRDTEAAIKNYEQYLKNFPLESTPELDQEKKLVSDRLQELKTGR